MDTHVPVYAPAIAGHQAHCVYPQRDGKAKLTWVHISTSVTIQLSTPQPEHQNNYHTENYITAYINAQVVGMNNEIAKFGEFVTRKPAERLNH